MPLGPQPALLSELETGRLTEKTRQTVAGFLSHWLDDAARARLKERTYEDYAGIIARYFEGSPLGRSRLDSVTPLCIQAFYGELLARGLAARTVRNCHTVLRQALRQAVRWRLLAHNPALDVDLPRARPAELCCLGPEDATRFLAAAAEDEYFFFWTFALATGVRFGEAAALKWDDVDWGTSTVSIIRSLYRPRGGGWKFVEPKTKKSRRSILLPPSLMGELREHRAEQQKERLGSGPDYQDHGLVFTTSNGSPVDCNNLRDRHFRPILRRAGLPEKLRIHDIRHSCATLLLSAGENPKIVSERLGHCSIVQTMDTYSHVLPNMQQSAVDKLERLLYRRDP